LEKVEGLRGRLREGAYDLVVVRIRRANYLRGVWHIAAIESSPDTQVLLIPRGSDRCIGRHAASGNA
jgi:hypothetical protein